MVDAEAEAEAGLRGLTLARLENPGSTYFIDKRFLWPWSWSD